MNILLIKEILLCILPVKCINCSLLKYKIYQKEILYKNFRAQVIRTMTVLCTIESCVFGNTRQVIFFFFLNHLKQAKKMLSIIISLKKITNSDNIQYMSHQQSCRLLKYEHGIESVCLIHCPHKWKEHKVFILRKHRLKNTLYKKPTLSFSPFLCIWPKSAVCA